MKSSDNNIDFDILAKICFQIEKFQTKWSPFVQKKELRIFTRNILFYWMVPKDGKSIFNALMLKEEKETLHYFSMIWCVDKDH
jgi:hypothetical protein